MRDERRKWYGTRTEYLLLHTHLSILHALPPPPFSSTRRRPAHRRQPVAYPHLSMNDDNNQVPIYNTHIVSKPDTPFKGQLATRERRANSPIIHSGRLVDVVPPAPGVAHVPLAKQAEQRVVVLLRNAAVGLVVGLGQLRVHVRVHLLGTVDVVLERVVRGVLHLAGDGETFSAPVRGGDDVLAS